MRRSPPPSWRRCTPPALRRTRRSEEHTSELQSRSDLVCRLLLEKKKKKQAHPIRSKQETTRRRPQTEIECPLWMMKQEPSCRRERSCPETTQTSDRPSCPIGACG